MSERSERIMKHSELSVALECGWGRLVFGQTFAHHQEVLAVLAQEVSGRRDICMYILEPQVLVSLAPFELFIDPSVTYRLRLDGERPAVASGAVRIRGLRSAADADEVNRLYTACVPRGRGADGGAGDAEFLAETGSVVVKPARGEQGKGITVGATEPDALRRAVELARTYCAEVLLEEFAPGEDLRVLLIDRQVVAAAVRRPAAVIGTGRHTIRELVEAQSRRRSAATGGESRIPLTDATEDLVAEAGWSLEDVLPPEHELVVCRTANLHTGGTIHDVTAKLHPDLAAAAELAAEVLDIPVVGIDLMVPAYDGPDYHVIEANERPGLANHEPQPTAQRFIDLLFPATRPLPSEWDASVDRPASDHQV